MGTTSANGQCWRACYLIHPDSHSPKMQDFRRFDRKQSETKRIWSKLRIITFVPCQHPHRGSSIRFSGGSGGLVRHCTRLGRSPPGALLSRSGARPSKGAPKSACRATEPVQLRNVRKHIESDSNFFLKSGYTNLIRRSKVGLQGLCRSGQIVTSIEGAASRVDQV